MPAGPWTSTEVPGVDVDVELVVLEDVEEVVGCALPGLVGVVASMSDMSMTAVARSIQPVPVVIVNWMALAAIALVAANVPAV